MKIEIEIGENLKSAIEKVVSSASMSGLRVGEQVKIAFGLNLTTVATHLGAHKQAMDRGMGVTIETKS